MIVINKICCFAGHGSIYYTDDIREKLGNTIDELIVKDNVDEFWVGNYGAFDRLATTVVREKKKTYSHILLTLVIPYVTQEINANRDWYYREYDSILIADIPEKTPK